VAVRTPGSLLDELVQPNGLLRVSKQILPGDDSTLLVFIDQFEELFSTVRSEETRRRFLDNLRRWTAGGSSPPRASTAWSASGTSAPRT
jgi:hypothetical protein